MAAAIGSSSVFRATRTVMQSGLVSAILLSVVIIGFIVYLWGKPQSPIGLGMQWVALFVSVGLVVKMVANWNYEVTLTPAAMHIKSGFNVQTIEYREIKRAVWYNGGTANSDLKLHLNRKPTTVSIMVGLFGKSEQVKFVTLLDTQTKVVGLHADAHE